MRELNNLVYLNLYISIKLLALYFYDLKSS